VDAERNEQTTPRRRRGLFISLVACTVAAGTGLLFGNQIGRNARPDSIPMGMLETSLPILLQIEYTASTRKLPIWESGQQWLEAKGVARYTFMNWTGSHVKLAFPAARSFWIAGGNMSPEATMPTFASLTFTLDLAPWESKSFSEDMTIDLRSDAFLKGGPGFRAFVFDAPRPELRKDYLVGTVFGRYTVSLEEPKPEGPPGDPEEEQRAVGRDLLADRERRLRFGDRPVGSDPRAGSVPTSPAGRGRSPDVQRLRSPAPPDRS
jgi:hypothetical protein